MNLVGQVAVEKPVTLVVRIRLCQKHRDELEPQSLLTANGRRQLANGVKKTRGNRTLNWDTLRVEWLDADEAARVLH